MRSAIALLAVALVLTGCTGCTADDESPSAPTSDVSSSVFTPSRVSIPPAPSTAWTTATRCPSLAAARATFGPQTLAQDSNDDVGGIGCVYRIATEASIDVTVIQGTVETNRGIWSRPPASIVRDAPELAPGAVVVYTPPDVGVVDQCLVAVDHSGGTLSVQVSDRGAAADRQRLCAPLGPMLRLLAAR